MSFVRFSLTRYRAFDQRVEVEFAPITIVIGTNHSGKTTLCRAPWFMSQPFARGATVPFAHGAPGGPPISLLNVARGLSGFESELEFVRDQQRWQLELHATARADAGNRVIFARVRAQCNEQLLFDEQDLEWKELQSLVRKHNIDNVHEDIDMLGGVRADAELAYGIQGFLPPSVGFLGESAPELVASTDQLSVLDDWSRKHLGVVYRVPPRDRARGGTFSIMVDDGQSEVPLADSGTGIVQILPVAAALLLLPSLPSLYCIEHPELHLHPHAHRAVAELLIAGHLRHPATRFVVETHSDTLLLRLRLAVVQGRLSPDSVRFVYVERGPEGSEVRTIRLNERGVPDWWPKGVFAEAQAEYAEMRRILNERDRQ